MKLQLRILVALAIILLVSVAVGAFYLISLSHNITVQAETEGFLNQHGELSVLLTESIENTISQYPDATVNTDRLVSAMRPLAAQCRESGILPALLDGKIIIYSDIPHIYNPDILGVSNDFFLGISDVSAVNIVQTKINGEQYSLFASRVPDYPYLTFVSAHTVSGDGALKTSIIVVFLVITLLLIITALVCFLLFRRYRESVDANTKKLTAALDNRQQFVDDLTHEMRTPLTSIVGYAEYLQNAKYTEKERKVATGHLYYMANRLNNLSEKLMELTFLRGEDIKMRPIVAEELFHDLRVSALPLLIPRNITLEVETELDTLLGDETLLLSLLINLVENAGRASSEGGTVIVRAYKQGSKSVIEIADTGRGMSREELDRITEPFYRVDKSRSREFGGVGLGLSIASQIIALHNAKMEVNSIPDVGTTVRIVLSN